MNTTNIPFDAAILARMEEVTVAEARKALIQLRGQGVHRAAHRCAEGDMYDQPQSDGARQEMIFHGLARCRKGVFHG